MDLVGCVRSKNLCGMSLPLHRVRGEERMGPLPQEFEELSAVMVLLPHPQRVNPEEMRERKKT